jgi:hypothetical protein
MEQFLYSKREIDFKAKFKTEICRNWSQGLCEFGDKCTFAHGYSELRNKDYLTVNYRTKKCKQFHEFGFCHYGSRCQFQHIEASPETASSSPREMATSPREERKKRLPVFVKLAGTELF